MKNGGKKHDKCFVISFIFSILSSSCVLCLVMCGILLPLNGQTDGPCEVIGQFNNSFSSHHVNESLFLWQNIRAHIRTTDNWLNSKFCHSPAIALRSFIRRVSQFLIIFRAFLFRRYFSSLASDRCIGCSALDHIWYFVIDMHAQMPKELFSLQCTHQYQVVHACCLPSRHKNIAVVCYAKNRR